MTTIERKIEKAERDLAYALKIKNTEWAAEIQEYLETLRHELTNHNSERVIHDVEIPQE